MKLDFFSPICGTVVGQKGDVEGLLKTVLSVSLFFLSFPFFYGVVQSEVGPYQSPILLFFLSKRGQFKLQRTVPLLQQSKTVHNVHGVDCGLLK